MQLSMRIQQQMQLYDMDDMVEAFIGILSNAGTCIDIPSTYSKSPAWNLPKTSGFRL